MRKPVLFGLVAVVVLLLGATGVLYSKYRKTSADYAEMQVAEEQIRNRYGRAINEIASIQDSLNAIVLGDAGGTGEKMLPSDLQTERRLSETRGDEALARIAVLKAGIERTKEKIRLLDANLKQSGIKVSGLQKMIANLKKSVTEKEQVVADLTAQNQALNTQVTGLTAEVQTNQETIRTQEVAIEDKRKELGTVYYVIGTKGELKDAGVVVAKGGVLGMGKTLEPAGQVNEARFTALDTDQETVIRIPAEKAKVISDQPVSSYVLETAGEDQLVLRIVDPKEFRKVKHLVIVTT